LVDTVQVLAEDRLAERLTGLLARQRLRVTQVTPTVITASCSFQWAPLMGCDREQAAIHTINNQDDE
jgi:hypothetical protein